MADGLKVQNVVMYGFVGGLLVLMAVMLATTPVPEWMDGSGDEGPQIGGPLTHLQEKRMPWTFDNGQGPPAEDDDEGGGGEEESPYDDPEVQGYGSRTLATENKGRYDMHSEFETVQTVALSKCALLQSADMHVYIFYSRCVTLVLPRRELLFDYAVCTVISIMLSSYGTRIPDGAAGTEAGRTAAFSEKCRVQEPAHSPAATCYHACQSL